MKFTKLFSSASPLFLVHFLLKAAKAQDDSCSGQNNFFQAPSSGECMSGWSKGGTYQYPSDFENILSEVKIYVCPTSERRVIVSNGIPDHDVVQGNKNSPCEKKWAISMPLNPVIAGSKSEPPARGIIAMTLHGVPAYGAQEAESTNAVEPPDGSMIQDAQFWYGHAATSNDWHVHNPYLGEVNPSSSDLLGYALDGFPIYGPVSDVSVLDGCNGRTVNGQYQYHVRTTDQVDADLSYCNGSSAETNWNYVLGCYSGTLDNTQVEDSDNFQVPGDCVEDVDTAAPTKSPVEAPTKSPVESPVEAPTKAPVKAPTKAPTKAPVKAPTPTSSSCEDSTLRFKVVYNGNKISRGCDWVAKRSTKLRCAADGVPSHCPVACGTSCSPCIDASNRFRVTYNGNKISRDCDWVAKRSTKLRCAADGVTDTCRLTCGAC
jgi:hypothetical protein